MTPATAANESASTRTAASTERVWPRPRRRSNRTRGAISKLKIMARVMGTNTPRAKYSRASTDTVAMIPKARSRFASGDGSGTGEAGESMRYILIFRRGATRRMPRRQGQIADGLCGAWRPPSLPFELHADPADVRSAGAPTPLVEVCSAPAFNANNCRTARTIIRCAHEGAREQAFPFQAHAGLRQLCIGCRPVISQQSQQRCRVAHIRQRRFQPALGFLNFGPGRVEQVIRQPIDPGAEFSAGAAHTFIDAEPLAVREDQVEAVVAGTHAA